MRGHHSIRAKASACLAPMRSGAKSKIPLNRRPCELVLQIGSTPRRFDRRETKRRSCRARHRDLRATHHTDRHLAQGARNRPHQLMLAAAGYNCGLRLTQACRYPGALGTCFGLKDRLNHHSPTFFPGTTNQKRDTEKPLAPSRQDRPAGGSPTPAIRLPATRSTAASCHALPRSRSAPKVG